MDQGKYDTLSLAVNSLTQKGYKESFEAKLDCVNAVYSKKSYQPDQLEIVESFRFEGMSNPADATALFAIKADDGTLGTLVVSYGAEDNNNAEMIKKIQNS